MLRVYSLVYMRRGLNAVLPQKYIDILHQKGAIEIIVTSGQAARVPFNIPRGFSLSWALRVREYDIGFGVRERKQARGGAIDEHLEEMRKIRVC